MWSQIRKFGMEYCDLPTMLWNVSVFLKVLTLNIYSKSKSGNPIILYIIAIVVWGCYFYTYLVCMLWYVFVRSRETGDMRGAMVVLSLGISSEVATFKLLYMFLSIKKIRALTNAFLEFDAGVSAGTRQAVNLLKSMRNVKRRAITYWLAIMISATVYNFVPCAIPGRHFSEDSVIIYGLEPMFETPNYEIAWTIMATCVYLACYISANVSTYNIVVIGYAESQLLTLSDEVTHMWADAEEHYKTITEFRTDNFPTTDDIKNKIMNEYVCGILKNIIKRHSTIKTLLNQIEDICRGPIVIGFILLVLVLISELLGGLNKALLQLPFAFLQVGIDCFIGQRVIDAGLLFQQAVYDSKWENFHQNNMKMVLIMLHAAQKTTAISAGGLVETSFACLMSAMRATYSVYMGFRSFMD